MEKLVDLKDGYTIEKMFEDMNVGDIVKVPYNKSKHSAIVTEKTRQHKYAIKKGIPVTGLNPIFRVSKVENKGFTTIIKIREI